jgi:hypothetical protein
LEIFDASGHLIEAIGRVINISDLGACFSSTLELTQGQPVRARMKLPNADWLDVLGEIVWTRRMARVTQCGIEFKSVSRQTPATNGTSKNGTGRPK